MDQIAEPRLRGRVRPLPDLKIVFLEGGWSWMTPFAWRLERACDQLREEVSHLQRRPSEYMRDHFWFTTQPIEEPEQPEQLLRGAGRSSVCRTG